MSEMSPVPENVEESDKISKAMQQLSAEEIAELREIFNLVDEDRGGSISQTELQHLMATVGVHTTKEELDKIVAEIDENNDGEIQFEEFVAVMGRKVSMGYTKEEVIEAFKIFADDNGDLSMEQLEMILSQYGAKKSNAETVNNLIENLDVDANGNFDFEQYVNLMMDN